MRFSALSKTVSYLLAGLGLLSLSFGGELSLISLGCLFLGFVASYFAEGAFVRTPAWARTITISLCVLLGVQLLRGLSGQAGWLALAMELAGWLTISRLCSRKNAADYQQIAMLAFIQLIAATVLTTDLAYAGLFLAFVIVTPWALTLAHLHAEIERNYPVETELRGGTDLTRVLASRRIVGPRFLMWTSLLTLPVLLMTLGLFILFPRVGLGFIGRGSSRGQHVTGFGNNIELGGFGLIRDDPTVVARVNAGRQLSFQEQVKYLRLRGTAFDHYDGRTWTRSASEPTAMSAIGDYYPLRRVAAPDDLVFKVVLDRLDATVLFLPTGTIGVRIAMRGIPGVARHHVTVTRNHGLDLRYQSADDLGLVYDAVVSRRSEDEELPVARDTDDARYLQMPDGHERVVALAKKLTEGLTKPQAIVQKLTTYLRDGDRFKYSLEQPDARGKRPLDAFLFDAKRGHCEYFATSLAIMLRAVGIPSRNVTGFYGGEYNSYGGYYGLRQSDAHSWVEALLPEHGWITLDPTPASYERNSRPSLFAAFNSALDAMRTYWMTRVVGYDLRTQISAVRKLSAMWRSFSLPSFKFGSGERSTSRQQGIGDQAGGKLLVVSALLVCVLIATAVLLILRKRKKTAARRLDHSAQLARELYRELERVLDKQGRARPKHVTAQQHAEQLTAQGFPAASAVQELTRVYVGARYGQDKLDQKRLKALKKLIDDVKRAA